MYCSTRKKHNFISLSSIIAVVLTVSLSITLLSSCGTSSKDPVNTARKNMSLDEMIDTYIYTLGTTDRSTIESLYLDEKLLLVTIGGEEELMEWLTIDEEPEDLPNNISYTKFDIITACDEYYVENEGEGYTVLDYEKNYEESGSEVFDILDEDYNFNKIDVEVEDVFSAVYDVEVDCDGDITGGCFWIICAKINSCWYIVDTESYMFEEDI